MAALTPAIPGKVADWQAGGVIWQRSEPAQTIGIQKRLALLDDLLVLLVPVPNSFTQALKLCWMASRLACSLQPVIGAPVISAASRMAKAFCHAVYLLAIVSRNEATPPRLRVTHRLFSLLLVGCQPFNPLTPAAPWLSIQASFSASA
jgi:lysylphosphatidylglycerol synthetase-like protein (DUF2156 family)